LPFYIPPFSLVDNSKSNSLVNVLRRLYYSAAGASAAGAVSAGAAS
jgi:hypothetical protein